MYTTDPKMLGDRLVEYYNKVNSSSTSFFSSFRSGVAKMNQQLSYLNATVQYTSQDAFSAFLTSANQGYDKTTEKIKKAQQQQQQMNEKLKEGSQESAKMANSVNSLSTQIVQSLKSVGSFAGKQALAGLQTAGGYATTFAKNSIITAAQDESTKQTFIARSGDAATGTAMYEQVKADALKSGATINDAMKSALTFMSGAENMKQIQDLNSISVRLSKLSPNGQSMEEISKIMYGAIQGKSAPLSQFNIPATPEESANLTALGASGNVDGFIDAFNAILEKRGITEEALQTMMDAPTERWGTLMTNFGLIMSTVGQGALTALLPLLDTLNAAFASGAFQPMIDMITNGLALIAQGFVWLITSLPAAWQAVVNSLFMLGAVLYNVMNIIIAMIPFILGLAVVWAILNAGMIFGAISAYAYALAQKMIAIALNIAAVAQRIFNFVMAANPIGLVIALIFGLITVFFALAKVGGGVKEVLSNAFGVIMDAAEAAVNFIIKVLNGAITGINAVSGFFADLLGVDAKEIPKITFEADFSKAKNAGQDFIKDFSLDDMKKSLNLDAINSDVKRPETDTSAASNFNQNLYTGSKAGNAGMGASGVSMPSVSNTAPNINTVGTVNNLGSINDTVDISSEDLKMMRDLAEMQAIQHFVTLTPTVQMTTGDINSGADLDTIVGHIGRKLEEEFVSTAQGVYT